jgi:SAM-dependent methyltransferase
MFSEADAYERFMGRWSARLAPRFVAWAGVRDGEDVLDVGSGTGVLASAVALAAPASHIVGIDPAAPYVALARSRAATDHVHFEVGSGQQLRFADARFDRVLSLLVLNFIPDRDQALAEMIRVTRPGGTVAAAVWDYGGEMEMLRTFWDAAIALEPDVDRRDERHMPLCRRGELAALWRAGALQDVVEEPLAIETGFASFDDYWAPFLEQQGPAGAYVAQLAADDRQQLQASLRRRLIGAGADRPVALRARAWAVRGTVARSQ